MAGGRKQRLGDVLAAMPTEWAEELSDESLRDMVGLQTCECGLEYLRSDRAQLLSARVVRTSRACLHSRSLKMTLR